MVTDRSMDQLTDRWIDRPMDGWNNRWTDIPLYKDAIYATGNDDFPTVFANFTKPLRMGCTQMGSPKNIIKRTPRTPELMFTRMFATNFGAIL